MYVVSCSVKFTSDLLSSCTLCQPVLTVSTSDKKYRVGVPFKVLTKQVGLYIHKFTVFTYVHIYVAMRHILYSTQ